jgi:Holliday junction resolvase RusA-like endonuclease
MIEIRFKLDPVAKGRPRIGNGRAYTPAKTRNFEKAIAWAAKAHMMTKGWGEPLRGPLEVMITFCVSRPKSVRRVLPEVKPDLDNLIKGVFDGCNGIFWVDDAQICMLSSSKQYTDGPGYIDLVVRAV